MTLKNQGVLTERNTKKTQSNSNLMIEIDSESLHRSFHIFSDSSKNKSVRKMINNASKSTQK